MKQKDKVKIYEKNRQEMTKNKKNLLRKQKKKHTNMEEVEKMK